MKNLIKKLSLASLICTMFLFLSIAIASAQQSSIAFVDSEIIIKQLPEYQQLTNELDGLQRQYLDTIQTKETELKTKAETFKTEYENAQALVEGGNMTEQEFTELNQRIGMLQQELQKLDQELTEYKQTVQALLLQRQSELFESVREKVTKAIENTAKDLKISFVFDKAEGNLIYGDKEFDITFKVLDKLK